VVPAIPVLPPLPPLPPIDLDLSDLQDRLRHLQENELWHLGNDFKLSAEDHRRIAEQARLAAEQARHAVQDQLANLHNLKLDFEPFHIDVPSWVDVGPFELQGPGRGPVTVAGPRGPITVVRSSDDSGTYNSGLNALQQRQYDRAIGMFDRVTAQKGARADGALYWKAFAQARLARGEEAVATLTELRRDFPQSRYLNDAKVLEADVRKMSGQKIDPQTLDANDEMKLLAINGIANTDPARAIPLLEGVLNATNTLANKKRALYVLALSNDPKAHQILLRYAKGGGNPELQAEAIRYLASRRDKQTTDGELKEIYDATQDANIRRTIIDAYRSSGDKTALFAVARDRGESVELRRSAISGLSNLAAPAELWTLYQQEPDAELRIQMINVFASMGAIDQLTQIARSEKDATVRIRAFRSLGGLRHEKAGPLLVELYGTEQDKEVRRAAISALAGQNNAEALVALARKETDLDLKRDIVRRLSDLAPKNKAAADYLLEVIR
jgi:HEAT repeat protein